MNTFGMLQFNWIKIGGGGGRECIILKIISTTRVKTCICIYPVGDKTHALPYVYSLILTCCKKKKPEKFHAQP